MSRSCSCCTRRSPCDSSITNVKFKSFAAWLTRYTLWSWNSSKAEPSSCRMPRMLCPSRLKEAHGPNISTRHSSPSAAESALERRGIQRIGRRIQRHGDVRLRGRNEIDRDALLLEDLEGVGEEAHLMPHTGAVHRDERDALLDGDGLHLGRAVRDVGADDRAFEARRLRRIDMQRNFVLAHRQHAARMQHLGAVARDFLSLVVVQGAQQARGRNGARVGAEQARHVGPDFQARGRELGGEIRAEVSEPPRPRSTVSPASLAAMKPCVMMTPSMPATLPERPIGREIAGRRQKARLHVGAGTLLGAQHAARIDPANAMPCALRNAQPSAVASSSPIAMTCARPRSSTSRLAQSPRRDSSAPRGTSRTADPARRQLPSQIAVHALDALESPRRALPPPRPRAAIRGDR
jgi:hypothetical protein